MDDRFTWDVERMHEEPGGAVAELLRQRRELLRKVEAASSYIDRIPDTWRMDIDLARELLHERGLTEEYEQRRLDYLRRLGESSSAPTNESETSDG